MLAGAMLCVTEGTTKGDSMTTIQKITVLTENIRTEGSVFVDVLDAKGKVVGVIRIALLHLGVDGKNFVEIRTETSTANSELRSEL